MIASTQARDGALVLRPSPWRWLLMLAVSLTFVAAGMVLFDRHPWGGGACVVLFGLCAVVGVLQLVPGNSHLRLDAQGFEVRSLSRSRHFAWRDVSAFGTMQVAVKTMVGWNFVPGYEGHGRLRKVNAGISGFEAVLPDTYGRSASDLAMTMETWRLQALAAAQAEHSANA